MNETQHFRFTPSVWLVPSLLLGLMWMVWGVERVFRIDLASHGISPRTVEGLQGLLFSPFCTPTCSIWPTTRFRFLFWARRSFTFTGNFHLKCWCMAFYSRDCSLGQLVETRCILARVVWCMCWFRLFSLKACIRSITDSWP